MVHVVLLVAEQRDRIAAVGHVGVDVVHVEVEVQTKVVLQAVLEGLDVGSAAVETFLFPTPGAKPERAFGLPRLVDDGAELSADFHHACGARSVVNGALSVVDGVVVTADDDDLRGLAPNLSAGDVNGVLLVVGDVDEHLQDASWSGGVEDRLFEDFTGVFGHGDEGKFARHAAAVCFAHLVDSTSLEDGNAVVGFDLTAVGVFVDENEAGEVVFSRP